MSGYAIEQPLDTHTETVVIAGSGAVIQGGIVAVNGMAACISLRVIDVTSLRVQLSYDQAVKARQELDRMLLAHELRDAQVGGAAA